MGKAVLGGITGWRSTSQQEQEKTWPYLRQEPGDQGIKERHRNGTADIKDQHRKEIVDIKEQHRKQTTEVKEQHRKQTVEIKEQHRKQTADIKGQHLKETTDLKKQLERTREAATSWRQQFISSNANSNQKYNALREAHQREQRERERLLVENSRQAAELQEYVKRLDRLAVVVENKKLYVGPQESDQKLSNDFEEIFRLVKRFSLAFLTEHQVSKKELDNPNFHKLLQGIMTGSDPEYRDRYIQLLEAKKTRRLLVQGIIGYMLAHYFFRRLTNDPGAPPTALDNWSKRNAVAIDGIEQTLWEGELGICSLHCGNIFITHVLIRAT